MGGLILTSKRLKPRSGSESLFGRPSPLPAMAGGAGTPGRPRPASAYKPGSPTLAGCCNRRPALTRLDVISAARVAPFVLPYLHGRPITMHRFPEGVGEAGFFAKDAPAGTPAFVETFTFWAEAPGRDVDFVLCNNLDTLSWLANLAALELHATLSRAGSYQAPPTSSSSTSTPSRRSTSTR